MNIIIENGIPMPEMKSRAAYVAAGFWKETFGKMEIGQSIFVPRKNFSMHIGWGRRLGRKFVVRRMDGGLRIWRAA